MSTPPTAARAEPMMKVTEMTRLMSMPRSMAMVLSWAVALIAFPIRENLMNRVSSTVAIAVVTTMSSSEERMMCETGSMNANSSTRVGNDRKSEVWARST